jgi:hypothetical protein
MSSQRGWKKAVRGLAEKSKGFNSLVEFHFAIFLIEKIFNDFFSLNLRVF